MDKYCQEENCNEKLVKVMYIGIPMLLCKKCATVYGLLSWLMIPIGSLGLFNGFFIEYSGSYIKHLFKFLKGDFNK